MDPRFKSRKFLLSVLVMISAMVLPAVFHAIGIADAVTMTSLGMITSVGAAYGLINVHDRKVELSASDDNEIILADKGKAQ